MSRRSTAALISAALCALLAGSARAWVSMGDHVAKLNPVGLRPALGVGVKPQPAPVKGSPVRNRPLPTTIQTASAGALPVAALTWVGPDGAWDADLPADLLTDAVVAPPGLWDEVELTLGEGAWLPGEGDLSGQVWSIPLADPDASGPLSLDLPTLAPDAPALDGATLVPPAE